MAVPGQVAYPRQHDADDKWRKGYKDSDSMIGYIHTNTSSRLIHVGIVLAILFSIVGCAEKSIDQLLGEARRARESGSYSSAVVHLKNVLQQAPDNAEARYLLGLTYNNSGDFYAAEAELRRAIDLGHEQARVAIGLPLLSMNQFQKVLDQVPLEPNLDKKTEAEILTLRARATLGLNRLSESRELLEQALVKQPEFTDALLVQAHLVALERKPEKASEFVERALASSPKSVEGWLMKGELARARGDYAGAASAYQKVLEIEPESILAQLKIVQAHIDDGKLDDARTQLKELQRLAPNNALAKYMSALVEYRRKNYSGARDEVLQVLQSHPDHLPSVLLAGAAELNLGSPEQAQRHLMRVVDQVPGALHPRKLLVASFLKSGQLQRAVEILQVGLQQAPKDSELMALAGSAYLRLNEFAKAVQFFEKAAQLDPESAKLRTRLGMSRLAMGETDRALADLESAVEINPDAFEADALLVLSHLRRANYELALQALQRLEKSQPKNPFTYHLKALVHLGKSDRPAARKYLDYALELNPSFVPAAITLAELDLKENNATIARRRFEAILERDAGNTEALMALYAFRPRIGVTPKELIHRLERARKLNPNSVQILLMLARAYSEVGDGKSALDVAQLAQTAQPNNFDVLETLGALQMRAGNKEQALLTYNKLLAIQPNSAPALVRLALAQSATGAKKSAADTLRKALSVRPDFIEAYAALAALELSAGRSPEALKVAQELQRTLPKSPAGFVLEANIMMAERKFPQAANAYRAAYGLGKNVAVLMKLHSVLVQSGKSGEAEGVLERALKESPNDSELRMYVGEVSYKSGKYATAIEQYEWLARKHPNDERYLNNLALAYQRSGDPRALESAERAYKISPHSAAVADTLGWILVEQGNVKRGLDLLYKAVAAEPNAFETRYHLAKGLLRAGEREKARQELERLLADAPGSQYARDAKQMLSQFGG